MTAFDSTQDVERDGSSAPSVDRRRIILLIVALYLFRGLLLFGYRYFEEQASNPGASWVEPFINEMTGALGALLLFPIVLWLCLRFPLKPGIWWKAAVAHVVAMPVKSVAHTLMNAGFRNSLYPVFSVSASYTPSRARFAQEFVNDIWSYAITLVLVYGFLYYRDVRTRELDTVRLQSELGRAKLRDLQSRLHPHFLFNTLNAISAHVKDDPAGAERMIEQLSALLRRSLSASGAQETTVAHEIETLELYLGIMKVRSGDRLEASVDVEPGLEAGRIPTLLLQPLVENAIEHGLGPRAEGGRVSVRITREGAHLLVVVEDDGVGLAKDAEAALDSGFGLSATAQRIRGLYGEGGNIELTPAQPGTRVRVRIPWNPIALTGTSG